MAQFIPEFVFFEPDALNYPLGEELYHRFQAMDLPIRMTTSHNHVTGIPGDTANKAYRNAKKTLVVGVKKSFDLEQSKPSADFSLPASTGCPAHCHYCYLQTTMGNKPYVRVYVNVEDLLDTAQKYMERRAPQLTTFEAACSSDPVAVEPYTGSLRKMIEFFGEQPLGRLRFVTKFDKVDSLLDANHNGHTRFRFSLNSAYVIRNFEPFTASFKERVEAAGKVARAHYPLGFILAPLMIYEGWQADYTDMLERLADELIPEATEDLTFELIMHRFTATAKKIIQVRYPKSKLVMNEADRKYKWGKYGKGKWVYKNDEAQVLREHVQSEIERCFPKAKVEYFT